MSEGAQKREEKPRSEKPRKFQAIRGTRDLLPPDTALWNRVEQTAREVFATFGFGEIRPPIFESTELFARGVGGDTDIVSKEMYTFEGAGGDLFALRESIRKYAISHPLGSVGDWGSRAHFLQILRGFTQGIEAELSSGMIVYDESATRAYQNVRNGVAHFANLLAGAGAHQDEIDQAFRLLKRYVADVWLGDSLSLRPEATASVCRAYIEHNMQQLPQPVKLYYIGPMFRRERPQKGRYRQFYQIGAEVLEAIRSDAAKDAAKELAKDASVDAEVIEMLMTFFDRIGLQGTDLSVNSIGHSAPPVDGKNVCRRAYVELLRNRLREVEVSKDLGEDSRRRIETNPLRVLDSKLEHEQPIIAKLPRIADHLCDECKTHYAELKRQLDLRGVKYKENWRLVRGLDYYMRTTFEITARGLGSQDAVCGGGRYDGLVELLGGPPTRGIGFAIGEDRVILSLQEQKGQTAVARREPLSIYIAWLGEKAYATAIRAAKTLRAGGFRVDMPATELKFGKALERASKLNARFALILGDDEVASGHWTLKTLADGSQQKLTEAALLEYLLSP
ncbi:MAG TPA: histidine--tRNA ligase [Candidatus Acidoferrum sp.]|nr:histidine--tRNA ligase [Candidatus Acidoferrum sp.]